MILAEGLKGTYWISQLAWSEFAARLVLVVVDGEVAPCEDLVAVRRILQDSVVSYQSS